MRTLQIVSLATVLALAAPGIEAQAPNGKAANGKPPNAKAPVKKDAPESLITEFAGKTFDQWKHDLKHPDPSVRVEAIVAVTQFGKLTTETVPILLDRCLDRDASPRIKAIMALSFIEINKKDIPKVVESLAKRINEDGQAIARYHAALSLQRFTEESSAKAAITPLIRASHDTTSYEIRSLSISLLRQIARDTIKGPPYAVSDALVRAAKDPAGEVRLEVAMGLGALGRSADSQMQESIERTLTTMTRDRDKAVCLWAYVGLLAHSDKVNESQVMAIAQPLVGDPSTRLRLHSARALGAVGAKAKVAIPTLLRALDDKDEEVVAEAIVALGAIGESNERVLKSITELSTRAKTDDAIKKLAKSTLEQLKKPAAKK